MKEKTGTLNMIIRMFWTIQIFNEHITKIINIK